MLKSIIMFPYLILAWAILARAVNLDYHPNLSDSQIQYYLSNPKLATAARYGLHDNMGNSMDSISVLQLTGKQFKYAAVYHTGYAVGGGRFRFKVNLAVSNNLMDWTYQYAVIDNADMPRIAKVTGSEWIIITHEQWMGSGPASNSPENVAFKLFYTADDLLSGKIASSRVMPRWGKNLDGTPSIYEFHINKWTDGYYSVDGQYGFHFWNGQRDVNGVTSIYHLFDPTGKAEVWQPSTADGYNNLLMSKGVNDIGQRDTLITTAARYNVQEGNIGPTPGASFDSWRIWLFKFGDPYNYPTGNGQFTAISPQTPKGSRSFGNPSIEVLDNPAGTGKALVISYYLFSEAAASGEAGSLLYYFNL